MSNLNSMIVKWDQHLVGKLGINKEGLCIFEYDPSYLQHGVSISPFELPLKSGIFLARPFPFNGGFGVFDDSLPDGWGLLIQDRYLQSIGIDPKSLNILDRLAFVGSNGRGALEFIPDKSEMNQDRNYNFDHLALEAKKLLQSEMYKGEGLAEFQMRGGSPGGARPKIFINYEDREWLVKFPALTDSADIGREEYKISLLAKECGVDMPETRLFEQKYFGVERFDRNKGKKYHVVSLAGLLRADYRIPSLDYAHLFKVVEWLTKDKEELYKAFRLMVFNFLIGNKDDHAKNFSMIFRDGEWHLSPAYDLLPSNGFNGYHTTTINNKITPTKNDLFEVGESVSLEKTEMSRIYQEIEEKVQSAECTVQRAQYKVGSRE